MHEIHRQPVAKNNSFFIYWNDTTIWIMLTGDCKLCSLCKWKKTIMY